MIIEIFQLADQLGRDLKADGRKIAVAESCTGGGICQALTDVPGSSEWFDRGFVTYSNTAKIQMLGVSPATLQKYGAVSEQTAIEMVRGAVNNSSANYAISVTGIAGPGGGTLEKPVGTVHMAFICSSIQIHCHLFHIKGDREQIRRESVELAIKTFMKIKHAI